MSDSEDDYTSSNFSPDDEGITDDTGQPTVEAKPKLREFDGQYANCLFYGMSFDYEWFGSCFPELAYLDFGNLPYFVEQADKEQAANFADFEPIYSLAEMFALYEQLYEFLRSDWDLSSLAVDKVLGYAHLDQYDRKKYDWVRGISHQKYSWSSTSPPFTNGGGKNVIRLDHFPYLFFGFRNEFLWLVYMRNKNRGGKYRRNFILGVIIQRGDPNSNDDIPLPDDSFITPEMLEFTDFVQNNPFLYQFPQGFIQYDGYLGQFHPEVYNGRNLGAVEYNQNF